MISGVGITDTSREMEALHAAMRKVGMSTYDDSFNLGPTPGSQRTNQTLPDTGKKSLGPKPNATCNTSINVHFQCLVAI